MNKPAPTTENSPNQDPATSSPADHAGREELVCLHVGCGSKAASGLHPAFTAPGWSELRLDIDPAVEPDVVASITDMAPVGDQCVDAVFSSHNLEHLEAHEVPRALAEFHRVLRPGGMLLVTLPDLEAVARLVVEGKLEETVYESPAGPVAPIDMLFGFRPFLALGATPMAHRTGFTLDTLRGHLLAAGFEEQKLWREGLDLWAMVRRP